MGQRLENWLSKAISDNTKRLLRGRFAKFADWATAEGRLKCGSGEVDDLIRKDFEEMPSHLFQDRYRDLLSKYTAYIVSKEKPNTALAYISSVRAFFSSETVSINLQSSRLPRGEMAMNEHRFTLPELKSMWLVADLEGKARLSTAVSLGWGAGDFLDLDASFIRRVLENVDAEGFVSFDYRRHKTKARTRGILGPCTLQDLKAYLGKTLKTEGKLWDVTSHEGLSYWLKVLAKEAGVKPTGTMRFHLLRKYVFDVVSANCGSYEAKLLVGKTIPLADATYLHGLEDRLLERYKKFAYPLLSLNGTQQQRRVEVEVEELREKQTKQSQSMDCIQTENLEIKNELRDLRQRLDSTQINILEITKLLKPILERAR